MHSKGTINVLLNFDVLSLDKTCGIGAVDDVGKRIGSGTDEAL